MLAFKGCPPMHNYTFKTFANFSIEKQAAYADGVIRGSYLKPWLKEQMDESNKIFQQ